MTGIFVAFAHLLYFTQNQTSASESFLTSLFVALSILII